MPWGLILLGGLGLYLWGRLADTRREVRHLSALLAASMNEANKRRDEVVGLTRRMDRVSYTLSKMIWRTLPLDSRRRQIFDKARNLTLADFQAMEPGRVLRISTESYIYPSETAFWAEFDFRFREISSEPPYLERIAVNGEQRWTDDGEWSSYTLWANKRDCSTDSFEGTAKWMSIEHQLENPAQSLLERDQLLERLD